MENEEYQADKTLSQDERRERYEALQARSKKLKKRIVIIVAAVAGALILLFAAVKLLGMIGKDEAGVPEGTYQFYSVYQGDIMEYQPYLEKDRKVYYCADPAGYGEIRSIEEGDDDFDANVMFLYNYLQTIIAGDSAAYNACFNETFFEDNERKGNFSPQMLHNMKITYRSEAQDENGDKLVTYLLEYMIHRNDGTFRRDVDSDASRPQYVTLRVSADGTIKIEQIVTQYVK